MLYVESVSFKSESNGKIPAICFWDKYKLDRRERAEKEIGKFGTGEILEGNQPTKKEEDMQKVYKLF